MSLTNAQLTELRTQVLVGMSKTALAIDRLDRWLILNKFDDDYDDVEGELLELEAQLHKLTTKLASLNHGNGRLAPPEDARMETIKNLSNEVEDLIRAQATADTMLSLAGRTLTLIAEVQKVGAGPAA